MKFTLEFWLYFTEGMSLTNLILFSSHFSSRCVSINIYNKFIISHTHHIQYNTK